MLPPAVIDLRLHRGPGSSADRGWRGEVPRGDRWPWFSRADDEPDPTMRCGPAHAFNRATDDRLALDRAGPPRRGPDARRGAGHSAFPHEFPVDRSSASSSLWPCPTIRTSCSLTSPPPHWTAHCGRNSTCCATSSARGLAMVLVTHDMDVVERHADGWPCSTGGRWSSRALERCLSPNTLHPRAARPPHSHSAGPRRSRDDRSWTGPRPRPRRTPPLTPEPAVGARPPRPIPGRLPAIDVSSPFPLGQPGHRRRKRLWKDHLAAPSSGSIPRFGSIPSPAGTCRPGRTTSNTSNPCRPGVPGPAGRTQPRQGRPVLKRCSSAGAPPRCSPREAGALRSGGASGPPRQAARRLLGGQRQRIVIACALAAGPSS